MTIDDLQQAIQRCNDGILQFNDGQHLAFLHLKRWYPLHATLKQAAILARDQPPHNSYNAAVLLGDTLGLWARIRHINFTNNFPVELTEEEKAAEVKQISKTLYHLTR